MIRSLVAVCVVACLPLIGQADTLSISDGGASYVLRTDDSGEFSSNLDVILGGSDLGFAEQWFLAIDGLGSSELTDGSVSTSLSGSEGIISFSWMDVEVELFYSITEVIPGLESFVEFSARVTNNRSDAISGTLANYIDYDLGSSSSDDTGFFAPPIIGAVDGDFFADRLYADADRIESGEFSTGIYEEAEFGTLNNSDNGFVDGDWVGAAQWDFQLDSGQFVVFNGDSIYAVPEPTGALAVILVGLAGFGIARRRR